MKILYVITRLVRGGASRMVYETASRVRERGHEVIVASGTDDTGERSFWPEFEDSPIRTVRLKYMSREVGLHDGLALWELVRLIERESPDCVHLHTSKAGTLGVLAGRITGTPRIVYSSHGHLFHPDARIQDVTLSGLSYVFYFWLRRITVGLSDRVVALSQWDRTEQVSLGLGPPSRYAVIPNGLPGEAIASSAEETFGHERRRELGLPEDVILVSSVGRLVKEKGQAELIRALSLLSNDDSDVHAVFVGDGPYRDRLEALAKEQSVSDRVHFVGVQEDVRPYLDASDLFCFPSYYESQGVALMEAMARGLPCLSTMEGGLRELVDPGVTAHPISPRSPEDLASAIRTVLEDPDYGQKLGRQAREMIQSDYSIGAVTERTLQCYESI